MYEEIICKNEYLKIFVKTKGVYIKTYKKGFPIAQLHSILSSHPEMRITSVITLKYSLNSITKHPQKFGELKERISVEITNNELKSTIVFNLPKEELDLNNRESLTKETFSLLNEKGIIFGIKYDIFTGEILGGKTYVIAEGIPPTNGSDAEIRMLEIKDPEPELREEGKVSFYDLKLINNVKAGEWLGERIEATEGIPGKSVKGEIVKPVRGKNIPLNYDKETVCEISANNKTVLYSKIDGAVNYTDGIISVSDHLVINGNVEVSTGNIKFDGYLTINGTVAEGFSVEATKDIEINGDIGLSNVDSIISTDGSIYIKGGIFSRGDVEIRAAKSVYTKFVDNTTIICGESVHIGYYCFNSRIVAKEVILDAFNGQLYGGYIEADIRVRAPIIGSEFEKKTFIEVIGFDRKALADKLNDTLQEISNLRKVQQKLKQVLTYFEQNELSYTQIDQYNKALKRILFVEGEIRRLEEKNKLTTNYLKTYGEGEISAKKKVYPNCTLVIKNQNAEIHSSSIAPIFYVQDGQLKQI